MKRTHRCDECGAPFYVVMGKVRCNGRWYTLIPRVHKLRVTAISDRNIERRASSPGNEVVNAVAPACDWWFWWPSIWIRVGWIEIRRHWRAVTLLDRSLTAMKRVFGGRPKHDTD